MATYVVLPFILPSISYFCQQFPRPFHHSFLFVTSSPMFPSIFITFPPLYSRLLRFDPFWTSPSLPVSLAFQGFIYACGGRRVCLKYARSTANVIFRRYQRGSYRQIMFRISRAITADRRPLFIRQISSSSSCLLVAYLFYFFFFFWDNPLRYDLHVLLSIVAFLSGSYQLRRKTSCLLGDLQLAWVAKFYRPCRLNGPRRSNARILLSYRRFLR